MDPCGEPVVTAADAGIGKVGSDQTLVIYVVQ